jgi:hypothetical protein
MYVGFSAFVYSFHYQALGFMKPQWDGHDLAPVVVPGHHCEATHSQVVFFLYPVDHHKSGMVNT